MWTFNHVHDMCECGREGMEEALGHFSMFFAPLSTTDYFLPSAGSPPLQWILLTWA